MILYIDHHDSFTDIFCDYCRQLGHELTVIQTSELNVDDLDFSQFNHIIIGAGPGHPSDLSLQVVIELLDKVKKEHESLPVLGVCLGHQLLAYYFGAQIHQADTIMHGRLSTLVCDNEDALFVDLPKQFQVCRYHSLLVNPTILPDCLKVLAQTQTAEIMALRNTQLPWWGVQYHPEAYLTEHGLHLLANFLR